MPADLVNLFERMYLIEKQQQSQVIGSLLENFRNSEKNAVFINKFGALFTSAKKVENRFVELRNEVARISDRSSFINLLSMLAGFVNGLDQSKKIQIIFYQS